MITRKLGNQGLIVSELGLGCMGMPDLNSEDLACLNATFPLGAASGLRYPEAMISTMGR